MASWQATNVLTGTTEGTKFNATGVTSEIWSVALTTGLANADVIHGPKIPAGTYLTNVVVDVDQLDSNVSPTITFECGYSGTAAAFIASGATAAKAGGIASANVAGTVGYTASTDTEVLVTITAGAATAKAGTMRIRVDYTASP